MAQCPNVKTGKNKKKEYIAVTGRERYKDALPYRKCNFTDYR